MAKLEDVFRYGIDKKVGFVSSYPPRECGIATYTKDLVGAISGLRVLRSPAILAVNDKGSYYNYSRLVKFQIEEENLETYKEAAEYVNDSDIDVVNLQHEFGLFGGPWGKYIISFLEEVDKPVVTTLHTVLLNPDPVAKMVTESLLKHSEFVIVMARAGISLLEQIYKFFPYKVRYIPHGCPNVPFVRSESVKNTLGLKDRIILSTFGLLSRGKGIEYAIQALPPIVREEPRIMYLVIGETHPVIRKKEGETYRDELMSLVDSLGLENNVRFVNRFLSKGELIKHLQATDIYILPYPNPEQISSGTLIYALCTGKAIVSTPFLHAQEVISEGCALECKFMNPRSMTDSIRKLLLRNNLRRDFEKKAYEYSRQMIWPQVAMRYVNRFYEVLRL